MKVVISLGGSIISREEGIDAGYLKDFSRMVRDLSKEHRFFIVTGGGRTARRYISAGRVLGAEEDFLDLLGIMATRLNAMLLSSALGLRLKAVPERIEDVDPGSQEVVVMGGTVPGHTTDAVSAMLAVHVGADLLVNATNVDAVYEEDPRENPGARRFERLTAGELLRIVERPGYRAGESAVFDPKAARIIHEHGIETVILDGRDVRNIALALKGVCRGTLITGRD